MSIGASGIGKTEMLQTMARSERVHGCVKTIGVDFVSINTTHLKIQVWDAGGHNEYDGMLNAFKRNVEVTLLCYSDGDIPSFEWAREKHIDGKFIVINLSKTNMPVASSLMHSRNCMGGITYTPDNWALARAQLTSLLQPASSPDHKPRCSCTLL